MFLFARLMCHYLYNLSNVVELNEELSSRVPPQGSQTLNDMYVCELQRSSDKSNCHCSYGKIIRRIFGETDVINVRSKKSLSWIVCAIRPLKWREIQCAVSINLHRETVNWQEGRFRMNSKTLYGSLVEIHSDDTVSLVHHTAKR